MKDKKGTHIPQTNISQLSCGMTPEELISEGYVDVDYFYDPNEEEWKREVNKMEKIARESKLSDDDYIEI
ncbi:hypothetical protein [Rivularia sp. UHCC 0363]|uniref:hypothetical protein n=1 Tax=Rivularia sp. UHCC 0363 TaxID=3110244 RepID=UPI002B1F9F1C|nr:hypothetical protein [Rivularia sp. UHCC 0363]MEA5596824.1 hypothetical protein [Rivularia sp. UHCC 0363]